MFYMGIGAFIEAIKTKLIAIVVAIVLSLIVICCVLFYYNMSLRKDIKGLNETITLKDKQCELDKEKIKSSMLEQINIKYEEGIKAGQVNAEKNTSIYNKKPGELKNNKEAVNKAKQEQKFDAIWLRIGTILTTNY
jgi:predicted Holliday junction resolvase-like endonuclease